MLARHWFTMGHGAMLNAKQRLGFYFQGVPRIWRKSADGKDFIKWCWSTDRTRANPKLAWIQVGVEAVLIITDFSASLLCNDRGYICTRVSKYVGKQTPLARHLLECIPPLFVWTLDTCQSYAEVFLPIANVVTFDWKWWSLVWDSRRTMVQPRDHANGVTSWVVCYSEAERKEKGWRKD